jgi:hypothetical protein
VRRLFQDAEPDWVENQIQSGLSSGEGMMWAVRDPITKMEKQKAGGKTGPKVQYVEVVADPGVSDKRLLAFEPEFSTTLRMLERQGNTLSGVIRQAWDTGRLNTLVKHDATTATDAHISIVGHTTGPELLRYLNRTEVANGFANRFLFVCNRRSKCLPRGGALTQAERKPLVDRLKTVITHARKVQEVMMSEAAWAIWDTLYPTLSAPRPGLLGAVLARAEAHVRRLAGIYALLDGTKAIAPVHLLAAVAVWDFCQQSATYIFGDALGDPVADEILQALRAADAKGLTRTQLHDLFGRNRASDDIGRALGVLLRQHLAASTIKQTGGRPVEYWSAVDPGNTKKTNLTKKGVVPAHAENAEDHGTKKTNLTKKGPDDGGLFSFNSFISYLDLAKHAARGGSPPGRVDALASAPTDPPKSVPSEEDAFPASTGSVHPPDLAAEELGRLLAEAAAGDSLARRVCEAFGAPQALQDSTPPRGDLITEALALFPGATAVADGDAHGAAAPHPAAPARDAYGDAPPAAPCRTCGGSRWDRASDGWTCHRCHPPPALRREVIAQLRAHVARHGVATIVVFGQDQDRQIGGDAATWTKFLEHGLLEDQLAVVAELDKQTGPRTPGDEG